MSAEKFESGDFEPQPATLITSPGLGAGSIFRDGKEIPVVEFTVPIDPSAMDDLEERNEYDPNDGRWKSFAMTIHDAREFIKDLQYCIDEAIQGPPDDVEDTNDL